jgi:thiosulfate/3-mercaptopyruvate sulfurtransferase
MMPNEATFTAFLKLHDIRPATSFVVFYDQKSTLQPYWATRAFWMFKAFGVNNVRVLDGGLPKWVADGRPTVNEEVGQEEDYKVTINKELINNFDDIVHIEKEIAEGKSDI